MHLIVIAMTYHMARPRDECFAAIDRNFHVEIYRFFDAETKNYVRLLKG